MGSVPPQLELIEAFGAAASGEEAAVGWGAGGLHLVVELAGWSGPCWVCAPASERAVDCVRTGRASAWTVIHHSRTGTVDVYRTLTDGSLHCSTVLCRSLPEAAPARAAA